MADCNVAQNNINGAKVKQEPRNYQLELLYKAIHENAIVFLGTGSGKTFIAAKLIKERSDDILCKKCVFLVPTVPLAVQQSSYLASNLSLVVRRITGSDNVDAWSKEKWAAEIEQHQVFVIVHQVFVNAIKAAFFDVNRLTLLIVDECHHATKEHPFAQVMERVRGGHGLRILGLTASIVVKKGNLEKFKEEMDKMEKMMDARIITVRNLDHLLKYVTCPVERYEFYDVDDIFCPELEAIKEETDAMLNALLAYHRPMLGMDDYSRGVEKDNSKRAIAKMRKLVNCVLDPVYTLGNTAGIMVANEYLERHLLNRMGTSSTAIKQQANEVAITACKNVKSFCEKRDNGNMFSSKVELLWSILRSAFDRASHSSSFSCLIFVQRRTTASTLCSVLNYLSERRPELSDLRVDFVVGGGNDYESGGNLSDVEKAQEEMVKLDSSMKRFYVGRTNCMVATQVLEEGIDVKQCNLVIRFDEVQTLRSYVQSKGRARARPSEFVIFIPKQDSTRRCKQIEEYRRLEALAIDCAHSSESPQGSPEASIEDAPMEVYYSDPNNKNTSPLVDSLGAISLVHQYVQSLPADKYTVLVPWFEIKAHEKEFICYLTMPHLCPLRETLCGTPCSTKKDAKRSVALKAVGLLHQLNELDFHLRPRRRKKYVEEDVEDKDEAGRKSGTKRRRRFVPISYASELGVGDLSEEKNLLYGYKIVMRLTDEIAAKFNNKHYKIHRPQNHPRQLLLLVGQALPETAFTPMELHAWCGTMEVKLEQLTNNRFVLTKSEVDNANFFHNLVFTEVTRSIPSWMHASNEAAFDPLILPFYDGSIDWSFVEELKVKCATWMQSKPEAFKPFQFDDAVIKTTHKEESQRYFVEEACLDLKANDLLPGDKSRSFVNYYKVKHQVDIFNGDDCMLRISNADTEQNFFSKKNDFSVRKSSVIGPKLMRMEELARHNFYAPELVRIHPIPASLWRDIQLLPYYLHRLSTWIKIGNLELALQNEGGFAAPERDLRKAPRPCDEIEANFDRLLKFNPNSNGSKSPVTLPSGSTLLRALTFRGAHEDFDLEREEMLGDSFLKFAASVYVFMTNSALLDEGELTAERTKIISNSNLFRLANNRSMEEIVQFKPLKPAINWRPPRAVNASDLIDVEQLLCEANEHFRHRVDKKACYSVFDALSKNEMEEKWKQLRQGVISAEAFKDEVVKLAVDRKMALAMEMKPLTQSLVSDKGLADCVEAMTGAFLLHAGHRGALQFLRFMGQDLWPDMNGKEAWFDPVKTALVKEGDLFVTETFRRLILKVKTADIETALNYKFKEPSFLLQALTHPSYSANRITESLERLEFLGDAVLDYVITAHLYVDKSRQMSPGELTAERSELVNNRVLARIAVEKRLHSHLFHFSHHMDSAINAFVADVQSARKGAEEENEQRDKSDPKVLADLVEALIGAVYMDSKFDLNAVWITVKSLYDVDFIRHRLRA